MAIPARKDFGVATEPPKKEKTEKKENTKEEISKLSPDHWFTGKISNILIILFAVFLVVKTLTIILGIDIKGEAYALTVAGATAVLYAVRWYQKQTTIEPVAKIAKVIIVVGLICLFVKPVWKVFSDKPLNITTITEGVKAGTNKPPKNNKGKNKNKIIIYQPGTYTLPPLKAGEILDHWIKAPVIKKFYYNFKSADSQFKVIYDDGEIANAWEDGQWPVKRILKCKTQAITNQPGIEFTLR